LVFGIVWVIFLIVFLDVSLAMIFMLPHK
ncbi:MAG: hypothetical protein UV28_C0022G0014, partial [Candidatus Collierbacteria bacterium GW2011_GWE2_42_48]